MGLIDAAKFNESEYSGRDQARLAYGSRLDNNPSPSMDDPDEVTAKDALYLGQPCSD